MKKEFLRLGILVLLLTALFIDLWRRDESTKRKEIIRKAEQREADSLKRIADLKAIELAEQKADSLRKVEELRQLEIEREERLRQQKIREKEIQDSIKIEEAIKRGYESVKIAGKEWMIYNLNNELYSIYSLSNICLRGWHIPSDDEWFRMIRSIDRNAAKINGKIAKKMINNPLRLGGTYWSATESNKRGYYWYYEFNEKGVFRSVKSRTEKLHCRCVKD